MLESDVSMAIQKKMRATFQKYLGFQKGHAELLFLILRHFYCEQLGCIRCKDGPKATHDYVIERDLIERAKRLDIYNLKPSYRVRTVQTK